ncbi:flap endonuclease 1-like [Eucalyptus grandis]|uniref:flap endonuclease 1-like n=1 Tax=Eucalyptus grandis TaxID=71139 RepID=UPI00192EA842|nr:flap endonuclease 1-like [Eucalyptus grandis]
MGIKGLTKLLADNAPNAVKEQKLESYFSRRIAIDASMSIYQFLVVVGRKGTRMLTNEAGEVTSHLQGMLYRTIRLLEAGIKPVYVFHGQPPDLKKQELAKRTVKVTQQHNEDCKRLLRLIGVPVVEATSEAEAQCAALCKAGKIYAVASEDMDSLTFGAPIFLRHLMDSSSRKVPVMEFEISRSPISSSDFSLVSSELGSAALFGALLPPLKLGASCALSAPSYVASFGSSGAFILCTSSRICSSL